MKKVKVRLNKNSYEIQIGLGILQQLGCWLKENGFNDRVVIITDLIVKELYGDGLDYSLSQQGLKVILLSVPDGEKQKSLETAGRLYEKLAYFHAERATPILALGGGVIGDLAGFVAATYLRGVPLIQIPTTLLAQVDSSIGGKVAVDYGQIKNKIGAFYQPKLVIADIATLQTLPTTELNNGLAEVIKYAVIKDKQFFDYLEWNLDKIKSRDNEALEETVYKSARIKAEVVEKDEKDLGIRHILNFGHTVGHAIESASDFRIRHGQAVAIGMLAAGRIATKLGTFSKDELIRLKSLIKKADLPTEIPDLDVQKVMEAVRQDKKIVEGKIQFVLPRSVGEVSISEVSPSLIEQVLVRWNEEA